MPQWKQVPNPEGTTLDEFRKLLELRRQALQDATQDAPGAAPMPVGWRWGWKAHIRLQGRDRDGSLKAHIVVTGPRTEIPYVRKVRLVRSQRLPSGLGKG